MFRAHAEVISSACGRKWWIPGEHTVYNCGLREMEGIVANGSLELQSVGLKNFEAQVAP